MASGQCFNSIFLPFYIFHSPVIISAPLKLTRSAFHRRMWRTGAWSYGRKCCQIST